MHQYPHKKKSPGMLYWTHPEVWMQCFDKTDMRFILRMLHMCVKDCKEIKQNNVTKSWHNMITLKRIHKVNAMQLFLSSDGKREAGTLVPTGLMEGKGKGGEIARKDVGWTNKVAKCKKGTLKAMRIGDAWKVMIVCTN